MVGIKTAGLCFWFLSKRCHLNLTWFYVMLLLDWRKYLMILKPVGAAEAWRQQKKQWSLHYGGHFNRLDWHNYGVSHEEGLSKSAIHTFWS